MIKAFSLREMRAPLGQFGRWLFKWGQIPFPIFLGLALGYLIVSPTRDLIVALTGIVVYFIIIVANPLVGLLVWAITYPFAAQAVTISLGSSIPDLTATRFCFAFLTAMLLAQTATGRRNFPRIRGAEIAALLFVGGMILSAPASSDPTRAMQVIIDAYLFPVLAYFIARNLILERKDLDRLLSAFLIIGAYTAIYAIYEQLTGNILFVEIPPGEPLRQYSENIRVIRGLFGEVDAFSVILGLILPIAFYRFIKAPTLGKKTLYILLIALLLGGEVAIFKRAAWLAVIVSFVIIQFFYPEFRRTFLVLILIFGIAYFFAGDQITGSEAAERATYKIDSANGRTDRWSVATDLWKEKPFTGHGYKRFDDLSSFQAIESYYLHILVSAGLFGFAPFIFFFLLTLKESIEIYRQVPRNPKLFVGRKTIAILWGMLAVYLVVSFSNYMAEAISHILTYILIGAIVGSQGVLLERKRRDQAVLLRQAT